MRSIIFANGPLPHAKTVKQQLRSDDLIIAADGGARHCLTLGIRPEILVGDFDSLAPDVVRQFMAGGTEIIRHPVRKDQIDLELALDLAIERGADPILIFAALGGRWDMTLGAVALLSRPDLGGRTVAICDGPQEIRLLDCGRIHRIAGKKGDTLSLVPLGQDARGVTLAGLEYALDAEPLPAGATRGISNVFAAETATVHLAQGCLLCIVTRRLKGPAAGSR